jgi:hypothetical protein
VEDVSWALASVLVLEVDCVAVARLLADREAVGTERDRIRVAESDIRIV